MGNALRPIRRPARACHQDERTTKAAILQPGQPAHEELRPNVLRHLSVIENEPGCVASGCHAHTADQEVLGVLDLDFLAADGEDQIAIRNNKRFVARLVPIALKASVEASARARRGISHHGRSWRSRSSFRQRNGRERRKEADPAGAVRFAAARLMDNRRAELHDWPADRSCPRPGGGGSRDPRGRRRC